MLHLKQHFVITVVTSRSCSRLSLTRCIVAVVVGVGVVILTNSIRSLECIGRVIAAVVGVAVLASLAGRASPPVVIVVGVVFTAIAIITQVISLLSLLILLPYCRSCSAPYCVAGVSVVVVGAGSYVAGLS